MHTILNNEHTEHTDITFCLHTINDELWASFNATTCNLNGNWPCCNLWCLENHVSNIFKVLTRFSRSLENVKYENTPEHSSNLLSTFATIGNKVAASRTSENPTTLVTVFK
jgi:hypothetical protein